MPHLTIEYSANLPHYPEAETLTALNATLCAHPQVQDEADLKTRFIVADSFEIGIAPANRAFVHAQLRLLAGRTPEAKKELSDRIAALLRERTPKPQGVMVQLQDLPRVQGWAFINSLRGWLAAELVAEDPG